MACSVCAGYSDHNCPCCGQSSATIECPDCEDGYVYYSFNIETREFVKTNETAYQALPSDEDLAAYLGQKYCQGEILPCKRCHGDGVIIGPHYINHTFSTFRTKRG